MTSPPRRSKSHEWMASWISIKSHLNCTKQLIELLKEFKDIFAWIYKDLKGIPQKIIQHQIELDITIPLVHQMKYWLNPNYTWAC